MISFHSLFHTPSLRFEVIQDGRGGGRDTLAVVKRSVFKGGRVKKEITTELVSSFGGGSREQAQMHLRKATGADLPSPLGKPTAVQAPHRPAAGGGASV